MRFSDEEIIYAESGLLKAYIEDYYMPDFERKKEAEIAIFLIWSFLKKLGVEKLKVDRTDAVDADKRRKLKEDFNIEAEDVKNE